jgi:uncharacterized membrane protein YbhN (UPF0104 family)
VKPIHKKLLRIAAGLAVAGFCIWFFRNIDWRKLREALADARWELVALAAAINFFHLLVKAGRWGVLLAPMGKIRLRSLFRYTLGSYAASNILPARFGEVIRVFYLRPHGIAAEGAVGVALLEKIYEGVSLLVISLPLPFLVALPGVARNTIFILAAAGAFGGAVMYWVAHHHRVPRQGLLARAAEGVAILRQPRQALWALFLSVVVWLTDAVEVMLVLAAVGVPPSLATALVVLIFINLSIALPSTPAQVGAFEAGGVFALGVLGVANEKALAFAVIYHFMQTIPVTIAGMEALFVWRKVRQAPPASEPVSVE